MVPGESELELPALPSSAAAVATLWNSETTACGNAGVDYNPLKVTMMFCVAAIALRQ
jgi:hypothetical protein